jgi:hypothetical protein
MKTSAKIVAIMMGAANAATFESSVEETSAITTRMA